MNFLWNMEIFRQFSVEFKCHLAGCSLIVSALNLRLGLQSVECQPWHALQHLGRFLYLPGSSKGCWVTEWMVRGAYTIPEGSNSTLWKVLVCGGFKWFLFSPKKSLGKRNPFWQICFNWVETWNHQLVYFWLKKTDRWQVGFGEFLRLDRKNTGWLLMLLVCFVFRSNKFVCFSIKQLKQTLK